MGKVMLVLSFIGIGFLFLVGLFDPNSPVMWMASTTENYTLLRLGLMAVLLLLIVTNPPRNVYLRSIVGLLSLVAVSWALSETYQNHLKLLDSFSILEVGVLAGLTVSEQELEPAAKTSKKKPAQA